MIEISTILFILSGLYFIYSVILVSGIGHDTPESSDKYRVSLIIPARNEENDLKRCFWSIALLDYPQNKLQVILVDHGSSDDTLKLMHEFASTAKFRTEIVEVDYQEGESCKSQALREGIKLADGEIFAFIDAETGFGPEWLKGMVGLLEDGYDMGGGAVYIENGSSFKEMQKYDWLFIASIGAGFAGLARPQSVFGKNMVIKRNLYEKSGGFSQNKVWTEDLELVNRCRRVKGRIGFSMSEKCGVYSIAADSWKSFFRQRIRWLKGGVKIGFPGIVAMITALLMDLAVVASLFLGLKYFIVVFGFKTISDYLVFGRATKEYQLKNYKFIIPVYSMFSVVHHWIMLFFICTNKDLKWR